MYHRISADRCDPWAICVPPQDFDEQLTVLSRARATVDLAVFADAAGYTAGGARVAVTFDDGYVDNLTVALPLLERHEVPATLFVVGNAIGRRREFWWDALQRAVLESGPLPQTLDLDLGSRVATFTVDHEPAAATDDGWRADGHPPGTGRQQLFQSLWATIVVLEPEQQDAAVDQLLSWSGQPTDPPPDRLPMTPDQLASFAAHPLISIGSHTLDHPWLPDLPVEQQRRQVIAGHRRVAELTGRRPDRFSYPYGRFTTGARAALSELGVSLGCTSVPVPATRGDDRLALPRLQATAMDGDRFARWLRDDHTICSRSRDGEP